MPDRLDVADVIQTLLYVRPIRSNCIFIYTARITEVAVNFVKLILNPFFDQWSTNNRSNLIKFPEGFFWKKGVFSIFLFTKINNFNQSVNTQLRTCCRMT